MTVCNEGGMERWQNDIEDIDIPAQYREFIEVIGIEQTVLLADKKGGLAFYLPRPDDLMWKVKKRRILNDRSTGMEYREIAQKYKCTEMKVREVCDGKRRKTTNEKEGSAQKKLF